MKISWKPYIWQTLLAASTSIAISWGVMSALYPDKKPAEKTTKTNVDSLRNVISNLSPEKLYELHYLDQQLYQRSKPGAVLKSSDKKSPNTFFDEFTSASTQIKWRNLNDIAVKNDTIYVEDKDSLLYSITLGFAFHNAPQINIAYLKYDGKNQRLKQIASYTNDYYSRLGSLIHEIRHIDTFRYILHVPQDQRGRKTAAANELFATIAGNLGDFATIGGESKNWDKAYRTKVNVWDVDYRLPENSQEIVDYAISCALDKLESNAGYRKTFIESEGMKYDPALEARTSKVTFTESQAVNKMQSAFKVNGKLTDIFSLASEKVQQRAKDFLNSNDDDMRLVIAAHKNNIAFPDPDSLTK